MLARMHVRRKITEQIKSTEKDSSRARPADQKQALPFYVPPIATIDRPFRHVPQKRALRLIVGSNQVRTDSSRPAILKAIASPESNGDTQNDQSSEVDDAIETTDGQLQTS